MDQIYKITIEACKESNQCVTDQDVTGTNSDSLNTIELVLNDSVSSVESESSFVGFCDIDLHNAVEELESKKVIEDEGKSANSATDLSGSECQQTKVDNFVDTQTDSTDDSNDSDDDFNLTIDEDIQ